MFSAHSLPPSLRHLAATRIPTPRYVIRLDATRELSMIFPGGNDCAGLGNVMGRWSIAHVAR